jgi:hypothetical protein
MDSFIFGDDKRLLNIDPPREVELGAFSKFNLVFPLIALGIVVAAHSGVFAVNDRARILIDAVCISFVIWNMIALYLLRREYWLLKFGSTGVATITRVTEGYTHSKDRRPQRILTLTYDLDAGDFIQEFLYVNGDVIFFQPFDLGMLQEGSQFVMLFDPRKPHKALAYASFTRVSLRSRAA